MWWSDETDDSRSSHVCSDSCTRAVRGSWVCVETGTVLGPALLENVHVAKPQPHVKNRADCSPSARGRFVSSIQDLLTRLVKGEKRMEVEGARAEKGRVAAMKSASRSIAADVEAGRLPNVGIALCAAWTAYEKSTNALNVSAELDATTETHLLHECGEFFCTHLAKEPGAGVQECRPKMDSLALATIFFMREGIPGKLKRSKFLSANLPDLGRLRTYGLQISHFTVR